MNASDVIRNMNAFPKDKLALYAGKYIAWSEDGTAIIAAADGIGELIDAVDARYPVGTEFGICYIPAGWDGTYDPPSVAGTPFPLNRP